MLWQATFPPTLDSPGLARAGFTRALRRAGVPPGVAADALWVLGEIASNAARHARTEFTVTATLDDGRLRVAVFDRDTRLPAFVPLDPGSTSGRGLHVLAGLADDWGWQSAHDASGVSGKTVWAELSLSPATAPACGDL